MMGKWINKRVIYQSTRPLSRKKVLKGVEEPGAHITLLSKRSQSEKATG